MENNNFLVSDNPNSKTYDLDNLFENLSSDVANVNKFISNLNEQKKNNLNEEQRIKEEKDKLIQARRDFDSYMLIQTETFENKKTQVDTYIKAQEQNLFKAEEEFKKNMDSAIIELELKQKEMDIKQNQLDEEKNQFEGYKKLELDRIQHLEDGLNIEKNQFEKYKEVENQKIELENKNLEEKYSKFKNIIQQFNSRFKPLIDNEEE